MIPTLRHFYTSLPLRWIVASSLFCSSGCAAVRVSILPSAPASLCLPQAHARVLWAPQWRSDQKDVAERERAAETGIAAFLDHSGCFASYTLARVPSLTPAAIQAEMAASPAEVTLTLQVHELGPVLKLFASPALIEGGTEVRMTVGRATADAPEPLMWNLHWERGGPGFIAGVASLPQDMEAALTALLQKVEGR